MINRGYMLPSCSFTFLLKLWTALGFHLIFFLFFFGFDVGYICLNWSSDMFTYIFKWLWVSQNVKIMVIHFHTDKTFLYAKCNWFLVNSILSFVFFFVLNERHLFSAFINYDNKNLVYKLEVTLRFSGFDVIFIFIEIYFHYFAVTKWNSV